MAGQVRSITDSTDYKKFYNENDDFHDYVHRYIKKNGKSVEQALREQIVKDVALYYMGEADKSKP